MSNILIKLLILIVLFTSIYIDAFSKKQLEEMFNKSLESNETDKLDVFINEFLRINGKANKKIRENEINNMNIEDIIVLIGAYIYRYYISTKKNLNINESAINGYLIAAARKARVGFK
ncbi:hypothetical protein Mgra_00001601 [Meloidogyne graminicola]|uniref:Uncharacterized protein n=1 Tax=Meloidogyne graminicola TaxID=189291 RepID=A0A8T0A0Y9_9BILA|nr:hypothetical protein Mgra_00001601 [Meloidogyne graminicola]